VDVLGHLFGHFCHLLVSFDHVLGGFNLEGSRIRTAEREMLEQADAAMSDSCPTGRRMAR
jgi:hypothetical protein